MPDSDHGDNEDTVVAARVADGAIDEDTIIRFNENTIVSPDKTIASRRRMQPVDDTTRVSRRGSRQEPAAPGRISGGRVAAAPGEKVHRYGIRAGDPVTPDVLRTVIHAPVSEARQSRDIQELEGESRKGLRRRGALVLVAVPLVTVLVAAAVVAIILLLSI